MVIVGRTMARSVQAQIYPQVNTNANLYRNTEMLNYRRIAEEKYRNMEMQNARNAMRDNGQESVRTQIYVQMNISAEMEKCRKLLQINRSRNT